MGASAILPETHLPIKCRGQGFNRHADVAKPQRTPGAMFQQMNARKRQLVFKTEYSNLFLSQIDCSRASE